MRMCLYLQDVHGILFITMTSLWKSDLREDNDLDSIIVPCV